MKIKICGLTQTVHMEAVAFARPDFVGFVFAKSKRQVSPEQAEILGRILTEMLTQAQEKHPLDVCTVQKVGVFVDAPLSHMVDMCAKGIIDIVQLHGQEDNACIASLKEHTGVPIIKAIKALSAEYIAEEAQKTLADYILLDSVAPHAPHIFGGTGKTFDWSMLSTQATSSHTALHKPLFLAGGITVNNVAQAADTARPFCVDVSSGVETNGVKDPQKIREIVHRVRQLSV